MRIRKSPSKKKLSLGGGSLVFGGIALVLGIVVLVIGLTDYTDHTERTDALVTERLVEVTYEDNDRDRDDRKEEITVFVDYAADGEEFTGIELRGLDADEYREGQELTVAYAPGEPVHVVTVQSTEEGAYDVFFYIGIGGIVLAVLLLSFGAFVAAVQRGKIGKTA